MTQAHANSHTHCQVAQADTQAKTWQRVCLFQRTTDRQSTRKTEGQPITAVTVAQPSLYKAGFWAKMPAVATFAAF
jgi:hypothetical protein